MTLDITGHQIFALSFYFFLGMFAARFVGIAAMEFFTFLSYLLLPHDDDEDKPTSDDTTGE